jgi:hypothetical protein
MRDRRVKQKPPGTAEERRGELFWTAVIAVICALWLAAMVVTSYVGYELKTPTRIENWRPEPAAR